jgi:hypothetical protein
MKAVIVTDTEAKDGGGAELPTMVPEQFEVRDRASAEWLVRKVVEAEAYMTRVKHQADREIRRTQQERDFLLMSYGLQHFDLLFQIIPHFFNPVGDFLAVGLDGICPGSHLGQKRCIFRQQIYCAVDLIKIRLSGG